MLGGLVAGTAGPQAALVLVVASFGASFGVSLLSGLRRVESYASLRRPATSGRRMPQRHADTRIQP
jgi:hypothetical protein